MLFPLGEQDHPLILKTISKSDSPMKEEREKMCLEINTDTTFETLARGPPHSR